jgi:anti-sigma regulatory factor (Ser/Thr protein kinase)
MKSIELKVDIDELYRLNEFVNNVVGKKDIHVNLILEEVFVNIVNYSNSNFVNVNAEYESQTLTIEFIDDGIEFNPLVKEDPKVPESIDEAQIGGLGIFLTKQLADEIAYDYLNGENHLKIIKRVE